MKEIERKRGREMSKEKGRKKHEKKHRGGKNGFPPSLSIFLLLIVMLGVFFVVSSDLHFSSFEVSCARVCMFLTR
jgi:hypothetical protein